MNNIIYPIITPDLIKNIPKISSTVYDNNIDNKMNYDQYNNNSNNNINNIDNKINYDQYNNNNMLIKIANRQDFVAGYLGQTAMKTLKLLEDCRGKVLFIDEAYSLINGEKDSYGQEAVSILNQYMSEHRDEIIVIFSGYKDKLNETIFYYQPGLERRCKWNFNVEKYTGKELSQIFKLQLEKTGWNLDLDSCDQIKNFFDTHISQFPCFGGDTLKLSFDCKLCHSEDIFDNYIQPYKTISLHAFNKAYKMYLKNKTNNDNDFIAKYSIYS